MILTPLHGAFVLLVSFANVQDPVRTAGDSQTIAAVRARSDSALAARRQIVDSINAAARRDSSALSRAISRLNQGPFQEHTLAFYGNVVCGAIMGLLAFLLRHRDASPGARRAWGAVGLMLGTFFGAVSFVGVFMFFGMLSIAFNPLPTPAMFAIALLATAFAIAWLMSLRLRRMR